MGKRKLKKRFPKKGKESKEVNRENDAKQDKDPQILVTPNIDESLQLRR